jgi:hypothetical protein
VNLQEHVILGGGAALALSPILGAEGSLTFWASSVLIDIDHYWDYLHRNGFRDWSWRKTFTFHAELWKRVADPSFLGLNLFHTIEWFLFVGSVAVWWGSSALLAVLGGMIFHLSLDLLRLASHRAMFKRALSIVEYWIRRQRLFQMGLNPDGVYAEALAALDDPTPGRDLFFRLPRSS